LNVKAYNITFAVSHLFTVGIKTRETVKFRERVHSVGTRNLDAVSDVA